MKQAGFSILEGLVASAVLSVAIAGTAELSRYLLMQSRRAQVLNRAIVIQSGLINALLNKAQYAKGRGRDTAIDAMTAGRSPQGFKILADPENAGSATLAEVGRRMGYDLDGEAATCTRDCAVWVDLDINCASLTARGCMVAYRVSVAPRPTEVTPAPLGAMPGPASDPAAFAARDYALGLSHDFFTLKTTSDCADGDPDNILITGLNRETGDVACVRKQVDACPAPKIAHSVASVIRNGQSVLELQCHPLSDVRCPADYVLERFDYGQLDAGKNFTGGTRAGMCGVCVYRWKTDVPWQGPTFRTGSTSSSASYSATVCNTTVYDAFANGRCAVVWDTNPPVNCPRTCYNYDALGNVTSSFDCSYTITASASTNGTSPNGADNVAACTVNVRQNSCSGGTTAGTAHGEWSGQCRVKERLRNPRLVLPVEGGSMACYGLPTTPSTPTPPTTPPANPVAGACGTANGSPSTAAPTSGLCAAGTASTVAGNGPWTWSCSGQAGGSSANCSAPKQATGGIWRGGGVGMAGRPCGGVIANGMRCATVGDQCYWTGPFTTYLYRCLAN